MTIGRPEFTSTATFSLYLDCVRRLHSRMVTFFVTRSLWFWKDHSSCGVQKITKRKVLIKLEWPPSVTSFSCMRSSQFNQNSPSPKESKKNSTRVTLADLVQLSKHVNMVKINDLLRYALGHKVHIVQFVLQIIENHNDCINRTKCFTTIFKDHIM